MVATGDTRDEAIQNFRDALLDLFDHKREQGRDVPNVTALEVREVREVETLETRLLWPLDVSQSVGSSSTTGAI